MPLQPGMGCSHIGGGKAVNLASVLLLRSCASKPWHGRAPITHGMRTAAGSCGLHAGRTLHYSRGNTTDGIRRAYILNFR